MDAEPFAGPDADAGPCDRPGAGMDLAEGSASATPSPTAAPPQDSVPERAPCPGPRSGPRAAALPCPVIGPTPPWQSQLASLAAAERA
ncbi:hypothetical protein [Streptomyces viridochromogenes]|uniref:hypothetical protein n=1 Tax=Streptomyces viridochromogenes TaxID=1938 RepID=UPI001331270E|nr:hypothetical protein [Streptomyces viridochromogenes]